MLLAVRQIEIQEPFPAIPLWHSYLKREKRRHTYVRDKAEINGKNKDMMSVYYTLKCAEHQGSRSRFSLGKASVQWKKKNEL